MRTEAEEREAVVRLSEAIASAIKAHGHVEPSDAIAAARGLITHMGSLIGAPPSGLFAAILVHECGGDARLALDAVRLAGMAAKAHSARKGGAS